MEVTCPHCGLVGDGPSDLGKTIRCRSCQQLFTVEALIVENPFTFDEDPIVENPLTFDRAPVRRQTSFQKGQSSFRKGFGATCGVLAALGVAFALIVCIVIGLVAITALGTSANKTFGGYTRIPDQDFQQRVHSLKAGMTYSEVEKIMGTAGVRQTGVTQEIYLWMNTDGSLARSVLVRFQDHRMSGVEDSGPVWLDSKKK